MILDPLSRLLPRHAHRDISYLVPRFVKVTEDYFFASFDKDSTRVDLPNTTLTIYTYCCAGNVNGECFNNALDVGDFMLFITLEEKIRNRIITDASTCIHTSSAFSCAHRYQYHKCMGEYDTLVGDNDLYIALSRLSDLSLELQGSLILSPLYTLVILNQPPCVLSKGRKEYGYNVLTSSQ